ncbi:MAG: hypothetical protein SH850_22110 [Planctomycetaceae bacterium]|nr:hypothetical protein [Planctomycetaceae bacterium]
MIHTELREIVFKMTDEEFLAFRRRFGGDNDRDGYVKWFVDHPEKESALCFALNMPTQAERFASAQLSAADAATLSERHARESNQLAAAANTQAAEANNQAAMANALSTRANELALYSLYASGAAALVAILALVVSIAQAVR